MRSGASSRMAGRAAPLTATSPTPSTCESFCAKTVEEGFIQRTVGFTEAEEEMDLDYCKENREEAVPYALSNSLGFGGHNASILLKRYEA